MIYFLGCLTLKAFDDCKSSRVNTKLAFTDRFFYNSIILIKKRKICYLNLGKALLFPKNQAICLKNLKHWRAPSTTDLNIFCWNFVYVSNLTMSTRARSGLFLVCLDLKLLIREKCKTRVCSWNQIFLIFTNKSKINKGKKFWTPFWHW